jgi:hypothetical protein
MTRYYLKCGGIKNLKDCRGNESVMYASNNVIRNEILSLHEAVLTGEQEKVNLLLSTGNNINGKVTTLSINALLSVFYSCYYF